MRKTFEQDRHISPETVINVADDWIKTYGSFEDADGTWRKCSEDGDIALLAEPPQLIPRDPPSYPAPDSRGRRGHATRLDNSARQGRADRTAAGPACGCPAAASPAGGRRRPSSALARGHAQKPGLACSGLRRARGLVVGPGSLLLPLAAGSEEGGNAGYQSAQSRETGAASRYRVPVAPRNRFRHHDDPRPCRCNVLIRADLRRELDKLPLDRRGLPGVVLGDGGSSQSPP